MVEGEGALFAALSRLTNRTPDRLDLIFPLYLEQADISPATREKYAQALYGIIGHHFGNAPPSSVKQGHIAQYLEMRKRQNAGTAGNREKAALSSVFEFAMRNGWADNNPCRGVRRNKERPSTRIVSNAEYDGTTERASRALKLLLRADYLTGMRLTDIMAMRRNWLTLYGIEWTESKTGRHNLMRWTPDLLAVLREAIAYGNWHAARITKKLKTPRPEPELVFINNRGWGWTQDGVSSAMRRAGATFGIRHLRSKAQTDAGEKNVLGHVGQMRGVYTKRRKLEPVA